MLLKTINTGIKRMLLFNTQLLAIKKLMASSLGWIIALCSGVLSFFAPERYAFGIVLVAIILDALFGTYVSIKSGRFVLSKLARVTTFKILSYGASLVMVFMLEKLAHDGSFIGVKVAAAWAIACEFWSMSASILIIWPDAVFFKIMRRHLRGEIESKIGKGIEDILPDEKKKESE